MVDRGDRLQKLKLAHELVVHELTGENRADNAANEVGFLGLERVEARGDRASEEQHS